MSTYQPEHLRHYANLTLATLGDPDDPESYYGIGGPDDVMRLTLDLINLHRKMRGVAPVAIGPDGPESRGAALALLDVVLDKCIAQKTEIDKLRAIMRAHGLMPLQIDGTVTAVAGADILGGTAVSIGEDGKVRPL